MKKPKYVYHGSGKRLKGDRLIPKKAKDLGENPDNSMRGIYASQIKDEAIAMGVTSCKGVNGSSVGIRNGKIEATIYRGWPKQDYFYLHYLPSKTFEERPKGSHQYVSEVSVKPDKTERLPVKEYLYLIRKATDKERKEWLERFKDKLE